MEPQWAWVPIAVLLGESATVEDARAVEAALVGPGVSKTIHLKTLHLGPEALLLAAKLAVDAAETGTEIAKAIDDAEKRVRAAVPIAKVICLEPDIYSAAREGDVPAAHKEQL